MLNEQASPQLSARDKFRKCLFAVIAANRLLSFIGKRVSMPNKQQKQKKKHLIVSNFSPLLQPLQQNPDLFAFHDQVFKKLSKRPKRESHIVPRMKPYALNQAAAFELKVDTA